MVENANHRLSREVEESIRDYLGKVEQRLKSSGTDAAEAREAQLEAVMGSPSETGTIPFVAPDSDDADLAAKMTSAANAVADAASAASAALAGEETHTGRKVRGTFLGKRRVKAKTRDIEAEALSMELEQIRLMREAGRLTNADARELREEVYMLQMGLEAR